MFETRKALVVVRTYPVPAKQGLEVSCTAAITDDNKWLRLFPVPYRFLEGEKRFHKYQWIEVETEKASDPRAESHKIRAQSIRILGDPLPTNDGWKIRRKLLEPLRSHCLCCLKEQRYKYGFPTLGLFKPKEIRRLICKQQSPDWTDAQKDILSQGHLFDDAPAKELEKIPFVFKYEFICDHPSCTGHKLSCTDWEMSESYRKWRIAYGSAWETAFRRKYETELVNDRDLHFFVGTLKAHPAEWIIVGLFYSPKFAPLPLFGE